MPVTIVPGLVLTDDLVTESFVRAAGPGGQNVNKVATAVELRFDLGRSPLAEDVRVRLRQLAGGRLTGEDIILIEAREHRTQAQNRESARAKLIGLVRRALVRPRTRRATRPTAASKVRRLESKLRRGRLKVSRHRRGDD